MSGTVGSKWSYAGPHSAPAISSTCSYFLLTCWVFLINLFILGFPGGAVVENLPANAGDTGSSPGLGRSHMPRRNWSCEPQLLSLRVWSLCSATREAATVRGLRTAMKSGPRSPQLEKARAQQRRPNTAKNKINKINKNFFKFIYFILFYFWLCWVFVAARGLSLVAASGGHSLLRCVSFSLRWLLLLRSRSSRRAGFSSCGT